MRKQKPKNDSVTELEDGSFVIKLTPDRPKNLDNIADKVDELLKGEGDVTLTGQDAHTIRGYMEQIRIIAAEMREKHYGFKG